MYNYSVVYYREELLVYVCIIIAFVYYREQLLLYVCIIIVLSTIGKSLYYMYV